MQINNQSSQVCNAAIRALTPAVLTWRPLHASAAQQVVVQMRYGLPAVCAAVIHQSETAVRDSQFKYQTVGDSMDMADDVIPRRYRQMDS